MTPTSVFVLGRMRHLDLLALWLELNPDNNEVRATLIGQLSKERLIAAVAGGP